MMKKPSPRSSRPASSTDSPMDLNKSSSWQPEDSSEEVKPDLENSNNQSGTDIDASQPLGPPPRPGQVSQSEPSYFDSVQDSNAHLSLEPNPFEQSFGGGGNNQDSSGKSLLPPVSALASPAIPGASSGGAFNWSNSLRSGPLSPAMLPGPQAPNDYFDSINRGFPTPNESSLRTGLTPGGGGSMFPAPSPGTALFQQLQSSNPTPSTLDFQRTALNVARKNGLNPPTSNPPDNEQIIQQSNMDAKPGQVDPFAHHAATDAANGLFMLSKAHQGENQFGSQNPSQGGDADGEFQNGANGSPSDNDRKPATRAAKGKKNGNGKGGGAANGRRKAEDTAKGPNKKAKGNNASAIDPKLDENGESEEEEVKAPPPPSESNGKKMTDDEKRKNFLERNRVAALKCRQRKKQWLANLQQKVELYSSENDALASTVTQLREEIVGLKTMLLAHKDCPVTQAQGMSNVMLNGLPPEYSQPNPYTMSMQQPAPGITAQGLSRR